MIDLEKAKVLREQGYTYQEIAEKLGCSVDWCKRNLKGVSKNTQEKKAIDKATKIAQSNEGITNGEIRQLVQIVYPYEEAKEYATTEAKAMARFKAAINKAENTLIRPYWMKPQEAHYSLKLILAAVDNINQSMTTEVDYIRKQLDQDQSYDMSIRYAIIKLLLGSGLVPEGAENHCNTLSEIALRLEEKNNCVEDHYTKIHHINTCVKKCAPKNLVRKSVLV